MSLISSKISSIKILQRSSTSLLTFFSRNYDTLSIKEVAPYVAHVELNRPDKRNSINKVMWREIKECFDSIHENPSYRAVVLSGAGKNFCSGIDLSDFMNLAEIISSDEDVARKCKKFYKLIRPYQESMSSLEKCSKPIIAALHSASVGAGVDMICSTDIRYATSDAWFQVKEVDMGLAADVGVLQRLPKIIGSESLVRELSFTARKMFSDEALKCGLVSRIFPDFSSMLDAAIDCAITIASKSPVAVQGTKVHLNYSRDHTVDESLEFMALWNMTMLQSEDLLKSVMAQMERNSPKFSDY